MHACCHDVNYEYMFVQRRGGAEGKGVQKRVRVVICVEEAGQALSDHLPGPETGPLAVPVDGGSRASGTPQSCGTEDDDTANPMSYAGAAGHSGTPPKEDGGRHRHEGQRLRGHHAALQRGAQRRDVEDAGWRVNNVDGAEGPTRGKYEGCVSRRTENMITKNNKIKQ